MSWMFQLDDDGRPVLWHSSDSSQPTRDLAEALAGADQETGRIKLPDPRYATVELSCTLRDGTAVDVSLSLHSHSRVSRQYAARVYPPVLACLQAVAPAWEAARAARQRRLDAGWHIAAQTQRQWERLRHSYMIDRARHLSALVRAQQWAELAAALGIDNAASEADIRQFLFARRWQRWRGYSETHRDGWEARVWPFSDPAGSGWTISLVQDEAYGVLAPPPVSSDGLKLEVAEQ